MRYLILLLFLLVGCSQQNVLTVVSSPEDRQLSDRVIAAVRSGHFESVPEFPSGLVDRVAPDLPKMQAILPAGPAATVKLVDAGFIKVKSTSGGPSTTRSYLAYEVDQGPRRALVRIGIARQGSITQITDLYVNQLNAPVSELTKFSLRDKSALEYTFIMLAVLSTLTCLLSLIALFRTKGVRRKWLWAIGCAFAFGQFAIDWASGQISVNPFHVQLLGAFATKVGLLASWHVGFGVPVVAIVFLLRRSRLRDTPQISAISKSETDPTNGAPSAT